MTLCVIYQTRVISRKRKAEWERRMEETDTIKAEKKNKHEGWREEGQSNGKKRAEQTEMEWMNEWTNQGNSEKRVEDKATGFSKMLIIFYQNGHRQILEDHIFHSAIRTSVLTYGRKEWMK